MKDPRGCGLIKDCPRGYELTHINASAAAWEPSNVTRALLRERQGKAHAACAAGRLRSGGWCLRAEAERGASRNVTLGAGRSYLLPPNHVQVQNKLRGKLELELELTRTLTLP